MVNRRLRLKTKHAIFPYNTENDKPNLCSKKYSVFSVGFPPEKDVKRVYRSIPNICLRFEKSCFARRFFDVRTKARQHIFPVDIY